MKYYLKLLPLLALLIITSCDKEDDAPVNKAPLIAAQSFSFSEDLGPNNIIGKVLASDPEGDAITYSITTNSDDLFEISSSGDLSLVANSSLDYDMAPSHIVTVQVSDSKLTASAQITINVIDVEENVAPEILAQTFTVAETSEKGAEIAVVVASDANGHSLTYSITKNVYEFGNTRRPIFELLQNDLGELRLANERFLDFEEDASHELEITVTDGVLSTSALITINVTNVNEAPQITDNGVITDPAEDIAGNINFATIDAIDPEGDQIVFSLSANPDALFEINAGGEISLAAGKSLDYETATNHTITVEVSDGALSSFQEIVIDVTDVEEAGSVTVSTFAGGGGSGSMDGTGTTASFNYPYSIASDANGNIYTADFNSNIIRKITPAGVVSTLAGTGGRGDRNGLAASSTFSSPLGIAVDSRGSVFVADAGNNQIRKITTAGVVSTFAGSGSEGSADGAGTVASFNDPAGIAFDANDNLYVTDKNNQKIRKITPAGVVSTLAGSGSQGGDDGAGTVASFSYPRGITVGPNGTVYIGDFTNAKIRKITPAGVVSTFAGTGSIGNSDGAGASASFYQPWGIELDDDGNLYVADTRNYRIRKITPAGVVSTFAGSGKSGNANGPGEGSTFSLPSDIAIDPSGNLYVTDTSSGLIRKITFN